MTVRGTLLPFLQKLSNTSPSSPQRTSQCLGSLRHISMRYRPYEASKVTMVTRRSVLGDRLTSYSIKAPCKWLRTNYGRAKTRLSFGPSLSAVFFN